MNSTGTAFFQYRPRRVSDLKTPHLIEQERRYRIVNVKRLSHIDYENFSEDLLADRQFLEEYPNQRAEDGVLNCILIHGCNKEDGILVVPKDGFVFFAAYYQG